MVDDTELRVDTVDAHGLSLVDIELITGRKHQIRVHFAEQGHPVAGDKLYGPNRNNERFGRQMLHAWRLAFPHPSTGATVRVEASIPPDMRAVMDALREIDADNPAL